MKTFTTISSILGISISGLAVLAACGGDDGGGGTNPKKLWMAPDGTELEVKLIGAEPPPY